MPGPATLYVLRHGETAWSLSRQHTGRTDIALTAHGEGQARGLGPALHLLHLDRVLTSPALRARRTCALAGFGAVAQTEPDLAEWDYGDYEGRRTTEIQQDRPGWSVYRDGCPSGEAPGQVFARADRLIARLLALGGATALFSHGQFGCCLAARWIGLPVAHGASFLLGAASLSVLGTDPNHPGLRVVTGWNAATAALHPRCGLAQSET